MSNKPALIITVIIALLAVAAVIFTVIILDTGDSNEGTVDESGNFVPGEELENEMNAAAERLVRDNFEVFTLFYIAPYEEAHFELEPYGNPSEDGFYTLRPGVIDFDTVDEIFALVDRTFVETAANIIKNDDTRTNGEGPVYRERVHGEGQIGVNEHFQPMDYNLVWMDRDIDIDLTFVSETEVVISITLIEESQQIDSETEGVPEGEPRQMRMLKESDGEWRLENIIY